MSISAVITVIITSVNWIAIFRYIRIQGELYSTIVSNLVKPRGTAVPHPRTGYFLLL